MAPLAHTLNFHPEQLAELREVCQRPRLDMTPAAVDELTARLARYGHRVAVDLVEVGACRDPNDDYVLALALAGSAEVILTEDKDLLILDPWREIRILRLHQFLDDHPLPSTP